MNIAITGSTGMVGTAVADFFQVQQHRVVRICRPAAGRREDEQTRFWDTALGRMPVSAINGHDCIIHLAGVNIAAERWSPKYKEKIFDSRVRGTRVLSQSLAELKNPPKVLLTASAVGFYGNHPSSESLDESCQRGKDFLSDVCHQWEEATLPASQAGVRVCQLRFGVVLSSKGGALLKMLKPFKMGLGGRMGLGRQPMSWIALDEIPLIIQHIIDNDHISGAVNCVSPEPVTNAEFARTLGKAVHRPLLGPMPSVIVKLLFGEMGEALLLGGQKVLPKKLLDNGYQFKYPALEKALKECLND